MTPIAVGTPVTFYWTNSTVLGGIVAGSHVDSGTTYYTLALFDPTSQSLVQYYPDAVNDTSKNPGSFQAYNAA